MILSANRYIVLTLILITVGIGVVAAELYSRWKGSLQLCLDVPCAHLILRIWVIENVIAQNGARPSYLAIGDSITEAADLPTLCGRRPINAGIGGATVNTFATHGRRLAELAQPDFVVIALGTNDSLRDHTEGFRSRLSALLSSLAHWRVILVPIPPGTKVKDAQKLNSEIASFAVPQAAVMDRVDTTDGVHLTPGSYVTWKQNIADAVSALVCHQEQPTNRP